MPGKEDSKNTQKGNAGKQSDTEAGLQEELSREASEGADSVGDVGKNRTLSGSSTWETLPEGQTKGDSSSSKGRTPGKQ